MPREVHSVTGNLYLSVSDNRNTIILLDKIWIFTIKFSVECKSIIMKTKGGNESNLLFFFFNLNCC